MRIIIASAAIAAVWGPAVSVAQDFTMGAAEFANSCAQCHGASGEGDGVIAGYLDAAPSDLTTLQQDNGGVFPVARIYGLIDGSAASGIHGSSDMPAWGLRYSAEASRQLGDYYSGADQEAFVRGRILALVEHISTLQK
jgi:mono/diheme cytochrome c family protein